MTAGRAVQHGSADNHVSSKLPHQEGSHYDLQKVRMFPCCFSSMTVQKYKVLKKYINGSEVSTQGEQSHKQEYCLPSNTIAICCS